MNTLPDVERAAQDNVFIFDPFTSTHTNANVVEPNTHYIDLAQQRLPTPPYTSESSVEIVQEGPDDRTDAQDVNFAAFENLFGPQGGLVTSDNQPQPAAPEYSLTANHIQQPLLQVQIPSHPSVPQIKIPSFEAPLYPINPSLSGIRSRSVSRERSEYRLSPNISRPPSSMRGPSPTPSSASASGRSAFPSMPQNSSSLLQPVAYGANHADPAQFVQYISQQGQAFHQQTRAPSPAPSVQLGYQHSESASGSPYPPLTPVTPSSYSPYPDQTHFQLPHPSAFTLNESQFLGQNTYASQSASSLVSAHSSAIASTDQRSHVPDHFSNPGYTESSSVSAREKQGLGINLIPPQSSPSGVSSQLASPNNVDFLPDPAPLPEASALLKEKHPSAPMPSEITSSTSMPVRKGAKAPTGRPRGRPKGSKNKPKVFDASGKPILSKTAKQRRCSRKQPIATTTPIAASSETLDLDAVRATRVPADGDVHARVDSEDEDADAEGDADEDYTR